MGGCCSNKVEPEGGFHSIEKNRKCRDVGCCLIFIIFWVLMIAIGIVAIVLGKPAKLLYGVDHSGDICGINNAGCKAPCGGKDLSTRKAILYPKPSIDMYEQTTAGGLVLPADYMKLKFYGMCMEACPAKNEWACDDVAETWLTGTSAGQGGFASVTDAAAIAHMDACSAAAPKGDSIAVLQMMGYSNYPTANGKSCVEVMQHCWKQFSRTTDIFFRCIPIYNTTKSVVEGCLEPTNVTADSALCQQKRVTTTTISEEPAQEDYVYKQLNSIIFTAMRYWGDLQNTAFVVFPVGVGCAVVIGALWLIWLRYCARCMVWMIVVLIILLMVGSTLFFATKAGYINTSDWTNLIQTTSGTNLTAEQLAAMNQYAGAAESEQLGWQVAFWIMAVVSSLLIISIFFLWRSINVAAAIIMEASKAVGAMPLIVLYPIVHTITAAVNMAWFLLIGACLMSAGSIKLSDITSVATDAVTTTTAALTTAVSATTGQAIVVNTSAVTSALNLPGIDTEGTYQYWLMIVHFFGYLWTAAFINGCTTLILAGAFSAWYFRSKEDGLHRPILRSLGRTLRYHMGSVAMGAFIIAVIQLARAILAYLDRKSKTAQKKNKLIKALFCMIQCCLWCFEKCVKYISKNAYIVIAIKGKGFCSAAMEVFGIIFKHMSYVSVVGVIAPFLMMLGKLVIMIGCGVIAWLCLTEGPAFKAGGTPGPPASVAFPVVVTCLLAYVVGSGFLEVYDMGISTILICFCIDLDENKGNGQFMMGDSLRKAMGKNKAKFDAHKAADDHDAGGEAAPAGGDKGGGDAPAGGGEDKGGPVTTGGGGGAQVKMI